MVMADAEFDIKDIKAYCERNNIKLVIIPTGAINTNSVVEKMIDKIKSLLPVYFFYFDEKIERRIKEKIYQLLNTRIRL
jgi:hypothetical protein